MFEENIVTESEWRDNFRMSRDSFREICNVLSPYLTKQKTNFLDPVSVEAQVGLFLYYISDEGRYRKVANAFGVSRATVSITVRKVATLVVKYMGPNLIKLPTPEDEVRNLASRFYTNHGFPQCNILYE